jgi:ubiquitin-protein ligase
VTINRCFSPNYWLGEGETLVRAQASYLKSPPTLCFISMQQSSGSRPLYYQRLNRDIADLLSHDFNCSSSCMNVTRDVRGLSLHICIRDGAYRKGHFEFMFDIPAQYPFKIVDVWAKHPIWHPNIDLHTGRVALPLDWSPVLTLNSLALAVQVNYLPKLYRNHQIRCSEVWSSSNYALSFNRHYNTNRCFS